MTLEEMDLNGVLKRAPDVVVIDEIAHTNAPGSRNRRRYEDVLESCGPASTSSARSTYSTSRV